MPVLQPDTSAAEDFSKPINPGTYPAKIVACDGGKSKAGNQKIMPKLKINVDGETRTRTGHHVVSGEGAMTFDQLLRSAGLGELADAYRDKTVSPKPPFDTDALVGQEVMVVIGPNLYTRDDGTTEMRDQIDGYLPK